MHSDFSLNTKKEISNARKHKNKNKAKTTERKKYPSKKYPCSAPKGIGTKILYNTTVRHRKAQETDISNKKIRGAYTLQNTRLT